MVMCDGDGDDSVVVNAGDDPHHDVDVGIAIVGDDETCAGHSCWHVSCFRTMGMPVAGATVDGQNPA